MAAGRIIRTRITTQTWYGRFHASDAPRLDLHWFHYQGVWQPTACTHKKAPSTHAMAVFHKNTRMSKTPFEIFHENEVIIHQRPSNACQEICCICCKRCKLQCQTDEFVFARYFYVIFMMYSFGDVQLPLLIFQVGRVYACFRSSWQLTWVQIIHLRLPATIAMRLQYSTAQCKVTGSFSGCGSCIWIEAKMLAYLLQIGVH